MISYKELYDLYLELENKLNEIERHIRKVLELDQFDNLQVLFREDEGGLLFVSFENDKYTDESLILEDDFSRLMSLENKDEMLEFLKRRSI